MPGPRRPLVQDVNFWGSICSIAGFLYTGREFLEYLAVPPAGPPFLSGSTRLYTILFLGLVAAICFGVSWSLVERRFGWSFGAGGGDALPEGLSAVVLSLTLTIPLVLVPPVYQRFVQTPVVPPRHYVAGLAVIILAAIGHLFLYGSRMIGFPGMRTIVFPLGSPAHLGRAVLMEMIYCATHFGTIVLPYRIIVWSQYGHLDASVVLNTALPAVVCFFGITIYILVKYPGSLVDKTWIQVRGVVAGLLLLVTLEGGMLM